MITETEYYQKKHEIDRRVDELLKQRQMLDAQYNQQIDEQVLKDYNEMMCKASQLVSEPPVTLELPGGDLFTIDNVEEDMCVPAKAKVVLRGTKISRLNDGSVLFDDDTLHEFFCIGEIKPVSKEYAIMKLHNDIDNLVKLAEHAINGDSEN